MYVGEPGGQANESGGRAALQQVEPGVRDSVLGGADILPAGGVRAQRLLRILPARRLYSIPCHAPVSISPPPLSNMLRQALRRGPVFKRKKRAIIIVRYM